MGTTTIINRQHASATYPTRFGKTFLALFGLGLLGVLTLIPMIMTQLEALPPELTELPTLVVALLSLLNPTILLAIAVTIGVLLAHRIGLRSLVTERVRLGSAVWPNLRPHITLAFGAGLIFAIVVLGLNQLMNPFANAEIIGEMPNEGNPFMQLLPGLLYGGITEELLLRWGMMSLLAWLGWRVFQRGEGTPRPAIM